MRVVHPVVREIALRAAKEEYRNSRRLGHDGEQSTLAGCKVLIEIREIAEGIR